MLSRYIRFMRDSDYYYQLGRDAFEKRLPRNTGNKYPHRAHRMEFYRGWDDASITAWERYFAPPLRFNAH